MQGKWNILITIFEYYLFCLALGGPGGGLEQREREREPWRTWRGPLFVIIRVLFDKERRRKKQKKKNRAIGGIHSDS